MEDKKHDYRMGSYSPNGTDAEKGPEIYTDEAPAVPTEIFLTGDSLYAKIQRAVFQFGVEPRGIERVPEDERTDTNLMKVGTLVGIPSIWPLRGLEVLIRLDSGCRPTWWSPLLLSALWLFQSLILVSSTPSSPSSSSIASPSHPLRSSPPSGPASVCARWCSLASSSAFTVSKLVSGYMLPPPMKHLLFPLHPSSSLQASN